MSQIADFLVVQEVEVNLNDSEEVTDSSGDNMSYNGGDTDSDGDI